MKAAHRVTILSHLSKIISNNSSLILFATLICIIPFNVTYRFFNRPITRSICIRTEKIFIDISTSSALCKCRNGQFWTNGQSSSKVIPQGKSLICHYLISRHVKFTWTKADFQIIRISDARPPQHFGKKFIDPSGVHEINTSIAQCSILLYNYFL